MVRRLLRATRLRRVLSAAGAQAPRWAPRRGPREAPQRAPGRPPEAKKMRYIMVCACFAIRRRRRLFCEALVKLRRHYTLSQIIQISSFLLQDSPRHPDTRLFEVREVFKRTLLLLGFRAYIRAYTASTKTCLNKNYGQHRIPKSVF